MPLRILMNEFTIGDLHISQDHDPFANFTIPHDVALDVVSRLNEGIMDGDPQDAEMISTDPATIHHPLTSSSAQTTSSASQTVDPAHHPGANRGKRPIVETRPPLFSKRQKSIAQKRPGSELLDLTEDPPVSSPQEVEVPREDSGLHPSTSELPTETHVDSAPQVTTGLKGDNFDLQNKLKRVQLLLDQANGRASEAKQ
ncbi:hypothetical protein LIER_23929 [Lithospermum erythrorhizon]|uniref:Uncharacterized protein n=1 Tax=Lithospermum erythrorhizon TaxID=34254 RepID=A0AAV3R299_LITER